MIFKKSKRSFYDFQFNHQCARCIFFDSQNEDNECDPYVQNYDATLTVSGNNGVGNLTTSCQANNGNAKKIG